MSNIASSSTQTQDIKPRLPAPPPEEEQLQIQVPGEGGAIWAVRIPRFLYDKWVKVEEGGVHLGTLVIDSSANPPKISLKIPEPDLKPEPLSSISGPSTYSSRNASSSGYDLTGLPPTYDLHVPEERAKNTWVFSETVRTVTGLRMDGSMQGKRKREKANPTLLGPVQHDCTLNPVQGDQYKTILRQRKLEAEHARRPVIRMEEVESNKGKLNMMSGGWANLAAKSGGNIVTNSSRLAQSDKATRLPRPQLRNTLFNLFRQKPYWGIGALRTTTSQPDSWLREVLRDVAVRVTEGAYKDLWELKGDWRGGVKDESGDGDGDDNGGVGKEEDNGGDGVKEEWGDEDDDEDEEDDFDEVM